MAVDSGMLDGIEEQGMGAVTEVLGMCGLELVMSGAVGTAVAGIHVRELAIDCDTVATHHPTPVQRLQVRNTYP